MTQEPNTPETVPGGEDVTPAEGGGNDSQPDAVPFYEALNKVQGTNFKSDEDAIEGLKNTSRFIGKLNKYRPHLEALEQREGGEQEALTYFETLMNSTQEQKPEGTQPEGQQPVAEAAPAINPENFVSKDQYDTDMWFAKNPKHAANANLLKALKLANADKSWDEIADLPDYKDLVEKAEAGSESTAGNLSPSNRIAVDSEEYKKDFEEAKASGNWMAFLAKHKGLSFTQE